jgi:hypothetical protein
MIVNNPQMVDLACLQKEIFDFRYFFSSVFEYSSVSFELLGFGSTPISATARGIILKF